jgi:hypothetical protein
MGKYIFEAKTLITFDRSIVLRRKQITKHQEDVPYILILLAPQDVLKWKTSKKREN